jgi:hypothetical protein
MSCRFNDHEVRASYSLLQRSSGEFSLLIALYLQVLFHGSHPSIFAGKD